MRDTQNETKDKNRKQDDSANSKQLLGEDLGERLEDYKNRYKRVLADYQNLEKRAREERAAWITTANKDLILRILPILDTLVLAGKHSTDETLKIVRDQFLGVLKGEGVIKIETKDKNFDPKLMECVETVEGQEGKVVEETRAGYLLHGTLIRPALVKVGKHNE
ncbi:MAG: nucleotide exchange factor GrpE [Patescibacteria group bacterium]|nr:nucleotide exchange factor GrpE [Patescibacteria group bacterium]